MKPSNFLYQRKHKRFVLVDFGLAQMSTDGAYFARSQLKRAREREKVCVCVWGGGITAPAEEASTRCCCAKLGLYQRDCGKPTCCCCAKLLGRMVPYAVVVAMMLLGTFCADHDGRWHCCVVDGVLKDARLHDAIVKKQLKGFVLRPPLPVPCVGRALLGFLLLITHSDKCLLHITCRMCVCVCVCVVGTGLLS